MCIRDRPEGLPFVFPLSVLVLVLDDRIEASVLGLRAGGQMIFRLWHNAFLLAFGFTLSAQHTTYHLSLIHI